MINNVPFYFDCCVPFRQYRPQGLLLFQGALIATKRHIVQGALMDGKDVVQDDFLLKKGK